MKYARENGCPWDEDTCRAAIEKDNQECLKYARENGCPWDGKTRRDYAAENDDQERLKQDLFEECREKGCPVS